MQTQNNKFYSKKINKKLQNIENLSQILWEFRFYAKILKINFKLIF